jgi:hypothetical protein
MIVKGEIIIEGQRMEGAEKRNRKCEDSEVLMAEEAEACFDLPLR